MSPLDKKALEHKVDYYARSILNIAQAEGIIDQLELEFKDFNEEVLNNLDYKKYLSNPSITGPEKIKLSFSALRSDASKAMQAAIALIITAGLAENIDMVYKKFVELVSNLKKQVYVEVVSAIELEGKLIDKVKKEIDRTTGLDIRVRNTIDKNIIGGIVIRIGDRIIDLSIKNKLEDMRSRLKSIELRGEEFGIEN